MRTKLALVAGIAALLVQAVSASAQVSVTATAGDPGPTPYTTVGAAFTAINAGTHQGDITISINGNTTEAASAILNNSGAGSAIYTSVLIQPTVAATITGNIVGAVIKLNGADNVTIDGRIGGVGRNLSVINTSTSTATAAIWLASVAVGNGASNNVIRNLELACGVDPQASTNSTFGIIMSGTTISTTSNGEDNDNNQFIANRIIRVRYGIVTRGNATNNNAAPVVTDNIIGPASFGPDQIGKAGIFMQADTGALISRNVIQNVGVLVANAAGGADRFGIAIGAETWGVTEVTTLTSGDYTITKNVIHDIVEEKTFSSVGIRLGTTRAGVATNNLVANNFIYNVRTDATPGDQLAGIGWAGGHTDTIVFNTISLTGDMDPGAAALSTTNGNGIRISQPNGVNNANLTLRNNSIYLDVNSSTAALRFYAITANTAAYLFGTGALDNNNYYINPANPQLRTGGLGASTGAAQTTEFATLADWQTAFTVPQDANSIQADPLHFSTTSDLHIQQASPNVETAATIAAITDDIDGQVRPNGVNPDIGGDEFYPSAGTVQFSSTTYTASEAGGTATITVTRGGGANGAAQVDYATVAGGTATGGAACGGGVDYIDTSGTVMWADLDAAPKTFPVTLCADAILEPLETINLALSNPVTATLGTPNTAVLQIGSTMFGSIDVGAGQVFTSLTNPSGVFDAINAGTVTSSITINITSDLTGETGAVALNEFAPGFTLTIKPSGAPRTITGSNNTNGIIRFNGADNVTIDGSLTGGTAAGQIGGDPSLRNMTVQNTSTTATAGAVIAAHSGPNGAQNNVFKNLNVFGQDPTQTLIGLSIGGATPGVAGTDNDNNRVENCAFQKTFVAVYHVGANAANPNTGSVLTMNDLSATGANRIRRVGLFVFNDNGIQINLNSIGGIDTNESVDALGMALGSQSISTTSVTAGGITNAQILRNRINGVFASSTVGFSAVGIAIAGSPGGANTIANNMISGVIAPSTSPDIVAGIWVAGVVGSSTQLFYNSIENTGDRGAVANQIGSFGIAITGVDPTVVSKNNIFFNSQTSAGGVNAKSFSIGMQSTTFTALDSNFNDFFVSGANGILARTGGLGTTGTDHATLLAWQTAVSDDANSLNADPLYVSLTDLHLQTASPVVGKGTPIAGITNDFDNDLRDATVPEMGADEVLKTDLSVTKLDGPDPVVAGTNLTYTITVTNIGPINATSASLSDTLPAGTTFVSLAAPGGWGCTTPPVGAGGTVTCTNPSFGLGDATFTLTVTVDPAVPSGALINNTATATSATADPNVANNSGNSTTTVATSADLSVIKADSPDPVTIGYNLTYTITVTNAGPSNAAGVSLGDTLPTGTTFVSLASPAGWSCTTPPVGSAGAVSCTNPSLAASSPVFTLKVAVGLGVPAGTVLTNTATAASSTADPNPGNESGTTTTTTAGSANVSIDMTVNNPTPPVGTNVTFTITAVNGGPSPATGVQVTDLLPAGLTFVSATPSQGTYTPATGVWDIGAFGDGGTPTLALVATVTVPDTIVNQATKTAQGEVDPNGSDNAAAVVLNGPSQADIQVQKTVDNTKPGTGTNVTFVVSATNAGPINATGVEITDLLPAGLAFVSATPSQGSYTPGTGVWIVGSIANGVTATLQIVATVTSPAPISNTATKTAENESDFVTINDADSVTLNNDTLADMALGKTASQEPVAAGTTFTYTIVVSNQGPATATGVTVTDNLPAGVSFVSATPSQGSCAGTTTISCTLGTINAGGGAQVALVVMKTVGGSVSNIATVAATEGDPNTANNSNTVVTTPVELLSIEVE